VSRELELFGFDTWDKASKVFHLVDPYDVQVLRGYQLVPEASDQVLAQSEGRPILVTGRREQGRFVALGFGPQDSDFVLRPAWPLFVMNLIDELYPRGRGETLASSRVAQDLRIPVEDVSASSAQVHGPLGTGRTPSVHTVPVMSGFAVVNSQQAGFFDVITSGGALRIAISAEQVPLAPEASGQTESAVTLGPYQVSAPQGMQARSNQDPWFWLVLGVLGVSYLEWWAYHRRWTV